MGFLPEPGVTINTLVQIVRAYHTAKETKLVVKGLQRFRIVEHRRVNLCENEEFAKKHFGRADFEAFVDVVDLHPYKEDRTQLSDVTQIQERLDYCRMKINHFMNLVKTHRLVSYLELRESTQTDFLDDPNRVLNPTNLSHSTLSMIPLLNLPKGQVVEAYLLRDCEQRLDLVYRFLQPLSLETEPVVVIKLAQEENNQMLYTLVTVAIILVLVGGLCYRVYKYAVSK